jgi:hypothetical protein
MLFSYFSDRISHFIFGFLGQGGVSPDHSHPTYTLLFDWDQQLSPLCLVYWLRWYLANFLPRLASNLHPLDLNLPSRQETNALLRVQWVIEEIGMG